MTTETEELPPLHALDKAANLAGWDCWEAFATCKQPFALSDSIIAHARTIAKYEPAPDPDAQDMRDITRVIEAAYGEGKTFLFDGRAALTAFRSILKERGL
ncbi:MULTISPECIES: hypothetical protein [Sphingomonadales]|uniref:hypothetical protein n=1 Tax=Sphingomonadales TaxID=204457 RepID=UPI000824E55A|nr:MULTISPECIES: hypothetical protein [Sphingomonadales]